MCKNQQIRKYWGFLICLKIVKINYNFKNKDLVSYSLVWKYYHICSSPNPIECIKILINFKNNVLELSSKL